MESVRWMQGLASSSTHAEAALPLPPTAATGGVFEPSVFSSSWAASKGASLCGTPLSESLSGSDGVATAAGMVGVQPCLADDSGVWAHAVQRLVSCLPH
jgi:hypothetical protein